MVKCSGGDMIDKQCTEAPKWVNQNGVVCCEYHKLLLDAFTWENRHKRKWTPIKEATK